MLESIKEQITRLIASYEAVSEENASLRRSLDEREKELAACKEKIQTLNKQINSLELKEAFTSSAQDNEGAKKKIDRMIRELDKCIALMEK